MSTCNICDRKHHALGLCRRHWDMYKKWGDPFYNHNKEVIHNHSPICSTIGCNEKYSAKGLCKKCYDKLKPNNSEYNKKYYRSHKLQFLEYNRRWRKENPKKKQAQDKLYLEKYNYNYYMSENQYQYMLRIWAKNIKNRDNYICQNCDSKENLNAHHILYKQYYPQFSLNENNGITLCEDCHSELHGFRIYS